MEFRKMVMITLYGRQQKRHKCIEQSSGFCGRWQEWDDLGGWHWNMYIIICETNRESRFDAWYRVLGAGALGWPRGMGWGQRWEGGSGWGTHVHSWRIQVNVWQNQYNMIKYYNLDSRDFFYLFIYLFVCFYFILLYNTVLVLPYIDLNPPWVYMRSQTWTPLPPPSQ